MAKEKASLKYKLVVVIPFDNYQRGDEITDPTIIEEVLKYHESYVVKVIKEIN